MQPRPAKLVPQDGVMRCPVCGCTHLRRVPRTGFSQKKILSWFGYFPWECGGCKEPFLIKRRFGRNGSHDFDLKD